MERFRVMPLVFLATLVLATFTASTQSIADDDDKYKFVFRAFSNKDWVGIRYRVSDGESWRAVKGKWVKCDENGAVPEAGRYRVQVIAEKDLADWWAFRYDTESGRTWRLSGGNWIDMLTVSAQP